MGKKADDVIKSLDFGQFFFKIQSPRYKPSPQISVALIAGQKLTTTAAQASLTGQIETRESVATELPKNARKVALGIFYRDIWHCVESQHVLR